MQSMPWNVESSSVESELSSRSFSCGSVKRKTLTVSLAPRQDHLNYAHPIEPLIHDMVVGRMNVLKQVECACPTC